MRLCELTIERAAQGLQKKEFSVSDLVSDCLEAIRKKDAALHAYLEVFGGAEEEARERDKILADNPKRLPPLFGIPIAVKDNIAIAGARVSAGSRILEHYRAAYDATVIRKLKDQGAILLGRTNMDEFAMGSSTEQSAFGLTKNPHDPTRVPGGSSGGSAAAVASNLCLAALGSDTGGSIRQPAAFSGVVGIKPTYGRVSRHGLIAMASSFDQIGTLTKSVSDAAVFLAAISGEDPLDSTTAPLPPLGGIIERKDIRTLKIGVPKEYFARGLDLDVKEVIEATLRRLEREGTSIVEVSLPHSRYALPAYYVSIFSEISANLARYDGMRYGERAEASLLFDVYADTRARGLGPEVKRRIILGTFALSAGYYDAYYLKAQKVRRLIRQDFEEVFAKVDLLAGPTTPTPAFLLGERMEDPLAMYLADIYTVAANLTGVPAISLPAGRVRRDGKELPVGLQLTGKWFEEEKLLSVAASVERFVS